MERSKSQELREQKLSLVSEARSIIDTADKDGRILNPDEQGKWDELMNRAEKVGGELEKEERREYQVAVEEELGKSRRKLAPFKPENTWNADRMQRDGFKAFALCGVSRLSPTLREAAYNCGIDLNSRSMTVRAVGVGDSQAGAEVVAPAFFNQLTEALKAYGSVLDVAEILDRETGATVPFPTTNDTGNVGRIVSEHGGLTEQGVATDSVNITPYLYSSDYVKTSVQFMQDSAFDVESWLAGSLGARIGRILNQHLTTGDGSGKPHGVVTGATAGKVHSPATGAVTYASLVSLQDSLDDAYDPGAYWMMSKTTLSAIRQLEDDSGRALIWSSNDNLSTSLQYTLLGKPIKINRDMASPASTAKAILYGDFKNYKVLQVRQMVLQRLDELFALNSQVGFLAFARYGGRLVDAGTHPVKYLQL